MAALRTASDFGARKLVQLIMVKNVLLPFVELSNWLCGLRTLTSPTKGPYAGYLNISIVNRMCMFVSAWLYFDRGSFTMESVVYALFSCNNTKQ